MLCRARERGVERVICIGTDCQDSLAARDFALAHEDIYWTYGIHPENHDLPRVTPNLDGAKLVAVGEVGLDYHSEGYDRKAQIRLFEEMLQLASDHDLPISFHVREAFDDFFPVVANFPSITGVVHSFTDSKRNLRKVLDMTDFYIGVNGLATYSTLPLPPLERIVLETDAPFLAPVPYRGKTNEPGYVVEIVEWLAAKLDLPLEEVAQVTTANAMLAYQLRQ